MIALVSVFQSSRAHPVSAIWVCLVTGTARKAENIETGMEIVAVACRLLSRFYKKMFGDYFTEHTFGVTALTGKVTRVRGPLGLHASTPCALANGQLARI